jgi:hypothetical protein
MGIYEDFPPNPYLTTTLFNRKEWICKGSVAEPRHFYAAPSPGRNFDADLAPAPAPISQGKIFKTT